MNNDPSGKLLSLEGLRALAVGAVIVEHSFHLAGDRFFVWYLPGAAGVRLFFVLSGFLITSILLRARDQAEPTGYPRRRVLGAFYGRRALRILPLAFAAIAIAWLTNLPGIRDHVWWYLTYTSNIEAARSGNLNDSLVHFWSLAIEEQFYLLWPALILWMPRRLLNGSIVGVIVLAVVVRGVLATRAPIAAYMLTPARLDALAVGGLLARLLQTGATWRWWFASGLALVVVGNAGPYGVWTTTAGESGAVFLSAALIDAAVRGTLWPPVRWTLTRRPLVYLGGISYGIYVLHYLVPALIHAAERRWNVWLRLPWSGWGMLCYVVAVTVPLAGLSWRFFERPINDRKRFLPYVTIEGARPAEPAARAVSTPV